MASRSAMRESNIDALTSRTALSRCDSLTLSQSSLIERGSMPSPAMARRLCSTRLLICRSTKTSGTGKLVGVHQLLDNLVLGLLLGLELALGEDGFANGVAQLVHVR